MPEPEYQRLLNCREAEYAGFQFFASPAFKNEQAKKRMTALTAAGKKSIVDIWFGANPPISWERFNLPNIALDPVIRNDFFAKATDTMINYFGPKNLYAVHLMEETGMQFGWDVDIPGDPNRDDDGYDNGSNWDNPPNWVMDRCVSGPNVLSIRKYNEQFKKDTGLDMCYYPIWTSAESERYNRWVQQTMEAGAHNEFARHVHRKYPGLRVYAFNMGPALIPQSKVLDGQFIDPYSSTLGVYLSLRTCRTVMRPEEELIGMVWGNRDKPNAERLPQQAACYMAGCNVLSTFGDNELQDEKWLNIVRDSVKPFIGLPVFKTAANVLILSGGSFGATLQHVYFWVTGFTHYDACDSWGEDTISLQPYDLALSWGSWHKGVPAWVRNGGVLMTVLPSNDLLVKEGFLEQPKKVGRISVDYRPDAWMRENLKLQESYKLEMDSASSYTVKRTDQVHQDQFLYVVKYGQGLIVLLPALPYVHPPWEYEASWESYRQLLTDLCRGALMHLGKTEAARRSFDDPQKGNDYLMATSSDGRFTVYILLIDAHGLNKSPTSFVVPGKDRISGQTDARLCQEHPVILIDNREVK